MNTEALGSPKAIFIGPSSIQAQQLAGRCAGLNYTLVFLITLDQVKSTLKSKKELERAQVFFVAQEMLRGVGALLPPGKIYLVGEKSKITDEIKKEFKLSIEGHIDSFFEPGPFIRVLKGLKTDFQKSYLDRSGRKAAQDSIDQEIESKSKEFVPIRLAQFISGTTCLFDIYIRLGETKYLKILNSNSPFDRSRIERFSQKGVTELYLRAEDHEHYLRYCSSVSTRLIESSAPANKSQIDQTLNFGAETLSFLKESRINSQRLEFAEKFVSNVQTLVKKMGLDNVALQPFLEDLHSYDHGVSTSMISSMIAYEMGIRSEKPVELVGLAAVLHDIGLTKISPELKVVDYRILEPAKQEEFLRHGIHGRKIADELRGLHSSIIQSIEFHHCRKFNPTLDKRITVKTDVNWVTEIIGFSDEFLRLIPKVKKGESISEDLKIFIRGTFSADILTAAHKLFPEIIDLS